jgi:hypothetical protein
MTLEEVRVREQEFGDGILALRFRLDPVPVACSCGVLGLSIWKLNLAS